MRPVRLELDGFTSFREHTVVDFDDADYFALVGPTGAGKSTIIDAICFALYGAVPRYDDRRAVAPVISQGKLEAKVRLDFSIDHTTYTAVRVVRRSGGGASTKEARLEQDGEPVAGTAEELSDKVAELVGLSFEHFTRCVVLPQGEFARFLHDKPKDRQDLLVRLLNLGIYRRMREEAARRAAALKTEAAVSEERLETDLAFATEDALAAARDRAAGLKTLRKLIDDAQPKLADLTKHATESEDVAKLADEHLSLIAELTPPKGVDGLAEQLSGARAVLDDAVRAVEGARERVDQATEALDGAPDKVVLGAARKAHIEAEALRVRLEDHRKALKAAEKAEKDAARALAEAEKAATAAKETFEHARAMNAAADLAAALKKGDPCPVCLRKVTRLPDHAPAHDLDKAKKAMEKSDAAVETKLAEHTAALGDVKAARAELASLDERMDELIAELEGHPDVKEIEAELERADTAAAGLARSREEEAAARDRHKKAQEALGDVQEREAQARKLFDQARDRLAALQPPAPRRDNVASDWIQLIEWATIKVADLKEEIKAAAVRKTKAEAERDRLLTEIHHRCRERGLEAEPGREIEEVIAGHTSAEHDVERIDQGLKDTKALRERVAALRRDQEVAHQLALHLSASPGRFENWIVNEALHRLVAGATRILRELSNDQYALTVDDSGSFHVTDRHNADEARSARTLSGGETFLASLSLALSLADELRDLSAEGAAKLDAIFLDEGFGTLDPETLETVAATVENLASEGRMVGVVTHVRELADRIPLQFRVRKEQTSTVERVVA